MFVLVENTIDMIKVLFFVIFINGIFYKAFRIKAAFSICNDDICAVETESVSQPSKIIWLRLLSFANNQDPFVWVTLGHFAAMFRFLLCLPFVKEIVATH